MGPPARGNLPPPPIWKHPFRPDLEERSLSWAANLGGLSFASEEPCENPISGVRINPPPTDPHAFLRGRMAGWAIVLRFCISPLYPTSLARINAGTQTTHLGHNRGLVR